MASRKRGKFHQSSQNSSLPSDRESWFEGTRTVALCCSLMSCLVYLDTLDLGFCFDDHSAIVSNEDLKPGSPWSNLLFDDFWGTPMNVEGSHKSYRPLCVLTFRLNYFLHALQPYGYHFVNVILHAAVTFLFVRVCCSVVECSDVVCFVAGALFAVHPIHTEAVSFRSTFLAFFVYLRIVQCTSLYMFPCAFVLDTFCVFMLGSVYSTRTCSRLYAVQP